ncbi:MAG: hypothetical protein K2J74_04645, partial [Muribaculaceae bacterium]|nr:hypothetical protein [Muribaculaceae bacterium]
IVYHRYNIDSEAGRLIIWNRDERIDMAEALKGYATVETSVTDEGRIVGVIRKTAEIPENHEVRKAGNSYAAAMLPTMMEYFHSAPKSLSYQWKRAEFSMLHTAMRLLPMGTVNKLKHLLTRK